MAWYLRAFFPRVTHRTPDTWIPLFTIQWICKYTSHSHTATQRRKASCDVKHHDQINMFTVCFPNCHVDGLLAPSLPPSLPLLALHGTPSLPSVQEAPGLSSGTRCRRSARAGEAGSKSGGTEKISSSWTGALHFALYYVTSPGWRTRPQLTQSIPSLTVTFRWES